jgi:hypothetical protein
MALEEHNILHRKVDEEKDSLIAYGFCTLFFPQFLWITLCIALCSLIRPCITAYL